MHHRLRLLCVHTSSITRNAGAILSFLTANLVGISVYWNCHFSHTDVCYIIFTCFWNFSKLFQGLARFSCGYFLFGCTIDRFFGVDERTARCRDFDMIYLTCLSKRKCPPLNQVELPMNFSKILICFRQLSNKMEMFIDDSKNVLVTSLLLIPNISYGKWFCAACFDSQGPSLNIVHHAWYLLLLLNYGQ